MQLISLLASLLAILLLVAVVLFVGRWHRACRRASEVQTLREEIAHIGISALVEYPESEAPLLALLEERYPRSEAILVVDLQQSSGTFGPLVRRFALVKVNHAHLTGVRALYRSRSRAFRRVVLVDLPVAHCAQALAVAREVALFDYLLSMQGESIVACEAVAYCASVVASQPLTADVSLRSLVGASATLARSDASSGQNMVHLQTFRPLAWQRRSRFSVLLSLLLPTIIVVVSAIAGARLLLVAAVAVALSMAALLYLSCRLMTENSLFVRVEAILYNFYRFLVDEVKKNCYLYKERREGGRTIVGLVGRFVKFGRNSRESL